MRPLRDRITANLLETFIEEQGFSGEAAAHGFEKFANYSVLSHEYPEEFEVEEVTVAWAGDTGLDGLAVVANGSLITSDEEIDDLCDLNNFLDVAFIFVQAKTSANFDAGDIGKFFFAVKDFFSEAPGLQRNEGIAAASKIKDRVFDKSAFLTRGNPLLKMFYDVR